MRTHLFSKILLSVGLMVGNSSIGIASATIFDDFLGDKKITTKDIFVCPETIEREKLLDILRAERREVKPTGHSTIPDLVAEPIEIEPGLWAAHKMADTQNLVNLITADKERLIYVEHEVEEARPHGTMGEGYISFVGTYHFYKKKKPEDEKGPCLKGYSLQATFYRKK